MKLPASILPVIAFVLLIPATTSCKKSVDLVSYSGSDMLSERRASLAAVAAGNKIYFAGGETYNVNYDASDTVDIYDVSSGKWTTAKLSQARNGLAAATTGNKILFAGGAAHNGVFSFVTNTVDIYDLLSNTWTTAQLSEARCLLAGAAAGNKILFAGGVGNNGVSKTVDIYDVPSNSWTTAQLSEAREYHAAATVGNKIFFAGGDSNLNLVYNNVYVGVSKTVDIYDVISNTWTTTHLSEARTNLAGAAARNKVFFAGGLGNNGASKTVDIYDVPSGTWTTTQLSEARAGVVAAAVDNIVLFGGGYKPLFPPGGVGYISNGGATDAVDIYNITFNAWSKGRLSEARESLVAAGAGNKILFAGGEIPPASLNSTYSASKAVDIFTLFGR